MKQCENLKKILMGVVTCCFKIKKFRLPKYGTKPFTNLIENQGTYFRPSTATYATRIARITATFMLFHFSRCLRPGWTVGWALE